MSESGSITVPGPGTVEFTTTTTAKFTPATVKPPAAEAITVSAPGTIETGASATLEIATDPALADVYWTGVSGDAAQDNPWYSNPPTKLPLTGGKGTIAVPLKAAGDFVKVMDVFPNPKTVKDSDPVAIKGTPPSNGNTAAQLAVVDAFLADWRGGANVERSRITYMTYDGVAISQSAAYWQKWKANKLGIARIIFPWSPSTFLGGGTNTPGGQVPSVAGLFTDMVAGCKLAAANGVRSEIVLQDLSSIEAGDMNDVSKQWQAVAAQYVAANLDPKWTIVAPFNEIVGDTNAQTNPVILAYHTLLREYLPIAKDWILEFEGADWDSDADVLGDGTPQVGRVVPPDRQCVAGVHHYPNANVAQNGAAAVTADYAGAATNVKKWCVENNARAWFGECGDWNPNDAPEGQVDPGLGSWPATIAAIGAALGPAGFNFAVWAVTDGAMNVSVGGSDADLPAPVWAAFAALI